MLSPSEKRARLAKALDYGGGTHTVDDVIAMVKAGAAQFWEHGDGAIVTEIIRFPRLKSVNFWLISGSKDDCLALEPSIIDWAIEQNCTTATATGRRGWGRVAGPLGWKQHLWTFYKPLSL
jgi:hypothetical protein